MQIKDVEKLTGLPAKTIRYYEDKKLINVSRNPDNDYREYNEENVKELRKIKIFRYLGFSIREIQDLLSMDHSSAKSFIKEKVESFNNQIEDFDKKRRLAWKLHDNYEVEDYYVETIADDIEVLEGPELEELEKLLVGLEKIHSVWTTLGLTLAYLLAIVPLFFIHSIKEYNNFYLGLALYTFGVLGIVSIWRKYFRDLKEHRAEVLEKNKREWILFPFFIVFLFAFGFLIKETQKIQSILFLPKDFIFYEMSPLLAKILVYVIILPMIYVLFELIAVIKKEESSLLLKKNRKYLIVGLFAWLLAIYFLSMNFTSVSQNEIRIHTPFNPFGMSYEFSEIESVKTGFEKKDGQFFYSILIKGHKSNFSTPSVNPNIEKYEDDTYLELEDFDKKLMTLGIKKESSEKYVEKNDLDKKYVDRFLRIIRTSIIE